MGIGQRAKGKGRKRETGNGGNRVVRFFASLRMTGRDGETGHRAKGKEHRA